jgi:hypothetical protein
MEGTHQKRYWQGALLHPWQAEQCTFYSTGVQCPGADVLYCSQTADHLVICLCLFCRRAEDEGA